MSFFDEDLKPVKAVETDEYGRDPNGPEALKEKLREQLNLLIPEGKSFSKNKTKGPLNVREVVEKYSKTKSTNDQYYRSPLEPLSPDLMKIQLVIDGPDITLPPKRSEFSKPELQELLETLKSDLQQQKQINQETVSEALITLELLKKADPSSAMYYHEEMKEIFKLSMDQTVFPTNLESAALLIRSSSKFARTGELNLFYKEPLVSELNKNPKLAEEQLRLFEENLIENIDTKPYDSYITGNKDFLSEIEDNGIITFENITSINLLKDCLGKRVKWLYDLTSPTYAVAPEGTLRTIANFKDELTECKRLYEDLSNFVDNFKIMKAVLESKGYLKNE